MRTLKFCVLLAIAAGVLAAQPIIATGGVIDGANFVKGRAVAPGSVVSIFGSSLATSLQAGDTIPLSLMGLNGTSVTFNGIAAGLYFVSDGQVNAQLPWDVLAPGATTGMVNAVVTKGGVASAPMAVPVNNFAPGIFDIAGLGYAIAINPDGSIAAPVGAVPGLATRPAKVGDALIIYANGLGPVDSPIVNGAASSDVLRRTLTVPTVTIGGQTAQILFSGLTPQFPGINQINLVVPSGATGNSVPILIQTGGVTSATGVIIAVSN
jgi:uncharacterized protein (TIGR03437 family)